MYRPEKLFQEFPLSITRSGCDRRLHFDGWGRCRGGLENSKKSLRSWKSHEVKNPLPISEVRAGHRSARSEMFIEQVSKKRLAVVVAAGRQLPQPTILLDIPSYKHFVPTGTNPITMRPLGNRSTIHNNNFTIHKAVSITDHECCILGQLFRPTRASGRGPEMMHLQ
jgi:hypothetical protein